MMHGRSIARLFGILLMIYGLGFVPSLLVSLAYGDGLASAFIDSIGIAALAGLLLWLPNFHHQNELSVREGFFVVTLFWVVLGVVGSLPFIISLHLTPTDAIFESISGFTTTGATVIVGLDQLPPSILYHRQQIQWLGGMGVIVLAVAILPLLGVGGMQLYRAETSGVVKQEKLTPRIAETARVLWGIYLALTVACGLAYWFAGMSVFDAVCHAFSTISTGGFSTHDSSIAYFDSLLIEMIAIFFMLTGGVNFALHFFAWRRNSMLPYFNNVELKWYLAIFLLWLVAVALSLYLTGVYATVGESVRYAAFQASSVLTSTGFVTTNFAVWPLHIAMLIVILSYIGGCAGSTAGGIKVVRIVLLFKLAQGQLFKLCHPHALKLVKMGEDTLSSDVLFSVLGFCVLYVATATVLSIAMMIAGLDLESAIGAVFATLNLTGPGLGEVAENFASVGPAVKWLGVFGMLVGRLEVFTFLILFMPFYWRN
ncbi:MAG: TrkH family potassium uptake protein [Xanthomonadales bacterium]|nr:TrkH family potassium uptake protein [Xanthomonadales bacterium]